MRTAVDAFVDAVGLHDDIVSYDREVEEGTVGNSAVEVSGKAPGGLAARRAGVRGLPAAGPGRPARAAGPGRSAASTGGPPRRSWRPGSP
ncbi:terpene synthase family protein [Kitasatospora sp. NPDC054795]